MKIANNLIAPTINLNGSNADRLIEDYINVMDAIRHAQELLAGIAPHGRDYQTAPVQEYPMAREQHHRRMTFLDAIRSDLELIALAVQEQKR